MPSRCWAGTATSASIRWKCGCATRVQFPPSTVSPRFRRQSDDRFRTRTAGAQPAPDVSHGRRKPKWGAMAITEPGCGSDSAAVTTTATRDGDHWVINGTKIFCTAGHRAVDKSEGFVVVWATVDKTAGRAGIKPFVVEHRTPGMQ